MNRRRYILLELPRLLSWLTRRRGSIAKGGERLSMDSVSLFEEDSDWHTQNENIDVRESLVHLGCCCCFVVVVAAACES